mgnify:CR=1 FL=1
MPNPELFPFTGIQFTLRDGTELPLSREAVAEALQYSSTPYAASQPSASSSTPHSQPAFIITYLQWTTRAAAAIGRVTTRRAQPER